MDTDICVVMGIDYEKSELTLYSPVEKETFKVPVSKEDAEEYDVDEAIGIEVDLESKSIL